MKPIQMGDPDWETAADGFSEALRAAFERRGVRLLCPLERLIAEVHIACTSSGRRVRLDELPDVLPRLFEPWNGEGSVFPHG